MNKENDTQGKLPEPFGKIVASKEEQEDCFKRILRDSPAINMFNGNQDFQSEIVHRVLLSDGTSAILLIPFKKSMKPYLHKIYLARSQYYLDGLLHRVSFKIKLIKTLKRKDIVDVLAEVLTPLHRVSNLYISIPSKKKPVYLEIPIEGAPPQVRVLEISLGKLKANIPNIQKGTLERKRIKGMKLNLFDLGELVADGLIKQSNKDPENVQIEFDLKDKESKAKLEKYLHNDYQQESVARSKERKLLEQQPERKKEKSDQLILIADDDIQMRTLLVKLLNHAGYRTVDAIDGYAAIRLIKNVHPDLVIMDISMPGISGFDTIRQLKQYRELHLTPFIIVSGHHSKEILEEALTLDIVDFIVKPFNLKMLLTRIQKILDRE
ncbi:response regulator [bacterium]|nr:response regulator [bacterium]